jgi:hypothetical protein
LANHGKSVAERSAIKRLAHLNCLVARRPNRRRGEFEDAALAAESGTRTISLLRRKNLSVFG